MIFIPAFEICDFEMSFGVVWCKASISCNTNSCKTDLAKTSETVWSSSEVSDRKKFFCINIWIHVVAKMSAVKKNFGLDQRQTVTLKVLRSAQALDTS